jgi:phosphatidylinositol phospholipase C delta
VDVYDGDDGEPVITHGGTLTSTTTVRDVATAIAKYAFVSSPYPIIISAEMHCSIPQQKKLTEVFAHAFGEALVITPVDASHKVGEEIKCLPSPEQLKGRVLLKAKNKYINATRPKTRELPDEPPSSDDSERDVEKNSGGLRGKFDKLWQRTPSKTLVPPKPTSSGTLPIPIISASPLPSSTSLATSSLPEGQPPKIRMAPELLPLLLYTTGVSFRGLDDARPYPLTHLFSLSEARANSLVSSGAGALKLVNHTREHLVRVYPKGVRMDSSNYEPHKYWAFGCQLVTVNWQTVGKCTIHAQLHQNIPHDISSARSWIFNGPGLLCS